MQATIPQLTRSSLHRCFERRGISRLPEVEGDKPRRKKFDSYPIGFFNIDLAEVRTAQGKLYLFVAIDRTSKFTVVELVEKADMRAAAAFLEALIGAVPYHIDTVLAGILVLTIFALILDFIVTKVESRLLVWRPGTAETEAL